jgi:hypothetical protein
MAIVANIIITNTTSPSNDQVYGDAHIFLTDSETGQHTNGNNVVVTFTQNVNGNISERKVTMPGQSIKIFAGLIADRIFCIIQHAADWYSAGSAATGKRMRSEDKFYPCR